MANMTCPICKGTGVIHEDATEYEFITREAINSRCLYCNGTGRIAPTKRLPDGRKAHEIQPGRDISKRLNVSKKAHVHTFDIGIDTSIPKETYEAPRLVEMALNPRLNKVLASGKEFLIVTETEPYYLAVYKLIRENERKQGTWTGADEEAYVQALETQLMKYQEVSNG